MSSCTPTSTSVRELKASKAWSQHRLSTLIKVMDSIREEVRSGMLGVGKYFATATARLNEQLKLKYPIRREKVRGKWRRLLAAGLVTPITAPTPAAQVSPITSPAATTTPLSKKRKWTSSDDEQLANVMTGDDGLLTRDVVPSDIYIQATKRLKGQLSHSPNPRSIADRWRRIASPEARSLTSAITMNPAQTTMWKRVVTDCTQAGSTPSFAEVGRKMHVKPASLRKIWTKNSSHATDDSK